MLRTVFFLSGALWICALQAGEAVLRSDTQLLSAPKVSAEGVLLLNAGMPVTIGARQGLWVEVIEPMSGWLKLRQLKRNVVSVKSSSLSALQSGRKGAGNAVSASGVRGLDSEMIKLSAPDHRAVEEFKTYSVGSIDGQKFAAGRSLLGREIAYLFDPESQQRSATRKGAETTGAVSSVKKAKPSRKQKVVADDDW